MKFFRALEEIDKNNYMLATYEMTSRLTLRDAAWNLAIGQSVGNPNVRNSWETDELFENHSCLIVGDEDELFKTSIGLVTIAFPSANTNLEEDGVTHLLCQLMGGHVDIDIVAKCRLVDLQLPESMRSYFNGPRHGLSGFREYTGQFNKPLLGAIIKPKTGISPQTLLEMTKELVDGGVDFIKEDEILADPMFCRLTDRVPLIANYLEKSGRKVVYCFCINGDPHQSLSKAKFVADNGGNGVHINVWAGLGVYNSLRKLNTDLFIHFQKSGDKVFTHDSNPYSISWHVMCMLAGLMGVDTIQSGMWGGYSNDSEEELKKTLSILHEYNVTPALSCGMHPGLIDIISEKFGVDYMANVGGAIHGHPWGTDAGARAMRQAVDTQWGSEFQQAIKKWGYVK